MSAVTSRESATISAPVVEPTVDGADVLAAEYWREVEATTRGLVRAAARDGRIDLRLLGHGPALFRLGCPLLSAGGASVACTYPIMGGVLVGQAGGALALEQVTGDCVLLESTLTDYVPRLAGVFYRQVQARIHALISRRYFARLERNVH